MLWALVVLLLLLWIGGFTLNVAGGLIHLLLVLAVIVVVYNLFVYAYMIPRICRECLGIPVVSWYAQLLKVVLAASVTYGSAWFFIAIPHSYSTLALIAAYAAATVAFLVGAVLLMGPDLRVTIWRLPRQLFARQAGAAP